MAVQSRTWWGSRFIEALERFTDPGRLGRGRAYASSSRILTYAIEAGRVTATVRGNINPYFGVYKEPRYTTTVELTPIAAAGWSRAIAYIAARAGFVARLLMNEMPDAIDDAFAGLDLVLLPRSQRDFHTSCSCPDYANPCKHVAGLCFLVASLLDADPFLLFELRGLPREELRAELARSPLGAILAAEMVPQEADIVPSTSFFAPLATEEVTPPESLRAFWAGEARLPHREPGPTAGVSALLIKRQGDYPPFWHKDLSFIAVMEDLYERIRAKNRDLR